MSISFRKEDLDHAVELFRMWQNFEDRRFARPFGDAFREISKLPKDEQLAAYKQLLVDVSTEEIVNARVLEFERSELRTLINRLTKSVP